MAKKYQLLIGGLVIAAALGYLFFSSFSSAVVYYYRLDELAAAKLGPEQLVRVSGELDKESVVYDPTRPILTFRLRSPDGADTLAVTYRDVMPDNFLQGKEAVVTGYLRGDEFQAESMLLKCPSKYESQAAAGGS